MSEAKKTSATRMKKVKYFKRFEDRERGDGKYTKYIQFQDTPERHAELLFRCQYEGIHTTNFFRSMITYFLEKDPRMLEIVSEITTHSKTKRKKIQKMYNEGNILEDKFGLNKEEIENIFDIIEEEMPNL